MFTHPPLHYVTQVMWHVSCQVSSDKCHMSGVMCQVSCNFSSFHRIGPLGWFSLVDAMSLDICIYVYVLFSCQLFQGLSLSIDEPLSWDVCLSVLLFVCAISLKWDSRHHYYPNGMHFRSIILVGIAATILPKRPVDNHDDDDDDKDDYDKNNDHKDYLKTTIYIYFYSSGWWYRSYYTHILNGYWSTVRG